MRTTRATRLLALLAAVLAGAALFVASPAARGVRARGSAAAGSDRNAVIFVHGFDGSGAQFESQQMRFTSNGYPGRYIAVLEYDSLVYASAIGVGGLGGPIPPALEAPLFARLDRLIAHMKALTHRRQVDLVAHSLGTRLMQDYLKSSKKRAANVAHYVNIDGQTGNKPPGGVRTLALWATKGPLSPPGRRIKGAKNVSIPDSSHVQCATSPLSFWWMYKFFTGKAPATTRISSQQGLITLSGRDVNFPQNTGLKGATVQLWALNQQTGRRTGKHPIASFKVGSSGAFGPIKVKSGRRYEFAEVRSGFPTHHFYYQPFIRSDHLIRLLESDVLRLAAGPADAHSVGMLIVRYKELWGDQGSQSDILKINGLSVCNSTTCPLSKEVNGLFAADFDRDGKSNPKFTWPPYQALGYFLSSVDVFAPAHSPPSGEVTVSLKDRGNGPFRTITFPNFPSTTDVVTVQFNDYSRP